MWTYFTNKALPVLFRYRQFAAKVGLSPQQVRLYFRLVEAEPGEQAAALGRARATEALGNAVTVIGVVDLILNYIADSKEQQRRQEALQWFQKTDPDYYSLLQHEEWERQCATGAGTCA